jgi:hypothetical protein
MLTYDTPALRQTGSTVLPLSFRLSKIFFLAFFSATIDPSDSYFLFADLVGFYTH